MSKTSQISEYIRPNQVAWLTQIHRWKRIYFFFLLMCLLILEREEKGIERNINWEKV